MVSLEGKYHLSFSKVDGEDLSFASSRCSARSSPSQGLPVIVRSHSCQAAFFDMPKASGPFVHEDWSIRKHESFIFRMSQKSCMGTAAVTQFGVGPTLSVTG